MSKKTPDTEIRKEKFSLFCDFTEKELAEKGVALAMAHESLESMEDEKKAAMDAFKGKIAEVEEEISGLYHAIAKGKEERMVDCEVHLNVPPGKKTCYRFDTGPSRDITDVVWVKDLGADEMQKVLPFPAEVQAPPFKEDFDPAA